MKKLWYSYLKELKLSSKGFYFYVEILMSLIIVVLLLFIVPENMESTETSYMAFDMSSEQKDIFINQFEKGDEDGAEIIEKKLGDETIELKLYELEGQDIYIVDDHTKLEAIADKERPRTAVILSMDDATNSLKYEYHLQGYESDKLLNFLRIYNSKDVSGTAGNIEVRKLSDEYEALNSREVALPSLLTFNGSLMGLFVIAAYIFLDKQEGIITAYAVTASKVWQYLMSKVLTLSTVTLFTTLAIVVPVALVNGTYVNYPMMILLLITSSFFASALGLLIASFFDNMTQAFGAIYTFMVLFMIPAIAYFIPSWEPFWIKLIPIHYLIQSFKETIISNGDMAYVGLSSLGFFVTGILIFLWANHKFKRSLSV